MKENSIPKEDMMLKMRILSMQLGKVPTLEEFINKGCGTKKSINKLFGSYDNLIEFSNLEYEVVSDYVLDIEKDMEKLNKIMNKFNLFPVRGNKMPSSNPIHRLIFCNILASQYPDIKGKQVAKPYGYPRTPVSRFLGYGSNNAIKYQLQEGAIDRIKHTHKEEWHKYRLLLCAFNDDPRYEKLQDLEIQRDSCQEQMNNLMREIIS